MTATLPAPERLRSVSLLLGAAGAAWLGVLAVACSMVAMTGGMGLRLLSFFAVWALMMTAMMLPSVVPFASAYARTCVGHRGRPLAVLTGGYLLVWAAAAPPAYGSRASRTGRWPAGRPVAVAVLAAAVHAA